MKIKVLALSITCLLCICAGPVSAESYIIQLLPSVNFSSIVRAYPSLKHHVEGILRIGKFRAIYGNFDTRFARLLSHSNMVVEVSLDAEIQLSAVQSSAPRHLARLSQQHALTAQSSYDYVYDPSAGKGIDVYVFDSGIQRWNPAFENRVQFGMDFTGEGSGDDNGHGTFVAGVIGSRDYGVAKKANLIDIKVIQSDGRGRLSWVLRGIDYVLRSKRMSNRPAVINMSFATPRNRVFNRALQNVISMDIPVVAAAGNQNTTACRYSPASAEDVLVIGSFDDHGDMLAEFTNWGRCVDAFAPGVDVDSLDAHAAAPRRGSANTRNGRVAPAVTLSGTSVSSAIGSGLVAYFMGMGDSGSQAVERIKSLTVREQLDFGNFPNRPNTKNLILYNEAGEPLW